MVGALVSLLAMGIAQRLTRRRREAEVKAARLDAVATENRRLYDEQREIALTLQQALLPQSLPILAGLEAKVRYLPAVAHTDIGGDWYDVIGISDRRTLFVIGDVSGHGIGAATSMASLRFAARAYAQQTSSPTAILDGLCKIIRLERDHHFATVLCGLIDREAHEVTIASAGHLPPLLLDGAGAVYLASEHGPPIGVEGAHTFSARTVSISPGATIVAFTDGLVERRGAPLDAGLEQLRESAVAGSELPLDALLDALVAGLAPKGEDDVTVLAIRVDSWFVA